MDPTGVDLCDRATDIDIPRARRDLIVADMILVTVAQASVGRFAPATDALTAQQRAGVVRTGRDLDRRTPDIDIPRQRRNFIIADGIDVALAKLSAVTSRRWSVPRTCDFSH